MQVTVDNLWSTPSTLHMRVTVWGPGEKWRHRYDIALALDELPEEALWGILESQGAQVPRDIHQLPLF